MFSDAKVSHIAYSDEDSRVDIAKLSLMNMSDFET